MPARSFLLLAVLQAGLLATAAPRPALAQTGENVLVVINTTSGDSVRVGEAYASARAVPETNVVRAAMPATETVERQEFETAIQAPIASAIARHGLHDRILYIVLAKGVPIRVRGTGGLQGTGASVDSELTLLYRRLVGGDPSAIGRVDNPYFLGDRPVSDARRFVRSASDIYLVTRLDGFSVDDALALIGRGASAGRDGQIVLDRRATVIDRGGDSWLQDAGARINAMSAGRAVVEGTRALAETSEPVLGYYSWGSNDPANRLRSPGFRFAPGAIGGMFVSTDGRTFEPPPDDWTPGESERRGGYYGSGSQSIAGDLIRGGMTGVSAYVDEPYLDATIRPQILFPAYLAGFSLVESYYLAMPYLSWQTMILGDPLAAPFQARSLTDAEIHQGVDDATGLPAVFARRRLDQLARTGMNRDALTLVLRAERLTAAGDLNDVEATLLEATDLEPRLTPANFQLATMYEAAGAHEKARARYERILAVAPNHPAALNNLAYSLAVHANQAARALPLAERALQLSNDPTIADTVGWIHHLLGDNPTASSLIERAVAVLPENLDVLVHAAAVRAALGDSARARAALEAALKIDPAASSRDDFKAVLGRLGAS